MKLDLGSALAEKIRPKLGKPAFFSFSPRSLWGNPQVKLAELAPSCPSDLYF